MDQPVCLLVPKQVDFELLQYGFIKAQGDLRLRIGLGAGIEADKSSDRDRRAAV
jgi:hypothetical protein